MFISEMKFVFLVLAGTLLVYVDAGPEGTFKAKGNTFFEGGLDDVQGALEDIESAGVVLGKLEDQLEELVDNSDKVFDAERAIEDGIASSDIHNYWKEGGGRSLSKFSSTIFI